MDKETVEEFARYRLEKAKRIREDSDYDDEYEPSYNKTQTQIDTASELIKLVEEYLNNK